MQQKLKNMRSGKRMIEETEKEMEVTTTSSSPTILHQEIATTSSRSAPKKNCRREADISQEFTNNYESNLKGTPSKVKRLDDLNTHYSINILHFSF